MRSETERQRAEMAGFSGEIERLRSGQAVGKLQSRIKELEQQVGMGKLLEVVKLGPLALNAVCLFPVFSLQKF